MDLGQPDVVQNLQLELLELINSEQHYQAFVQYSNSTQVSVYKAEIVDTTYM